MGVKINTPHYLAKLENLPAGTHTYTVVVSQLDSLSTIYYSIRVSVYPPVNDVYTLVLCTKRIQLAILCVGLFVCYFCE